MITQYLRYLRGSFALSKRFCFFCFLNRNIFSLCKIRAHVPTLSERSVVQYKLVLASDEANWWGKYIASPMVAKRMSLISSNNGAKVICRSGDGLLRSDSKCSIFNLSASNFIFKRIFSLISICFSTSEEISDTAEKYSSLGLTGDRWGWSPTQINKNKTVKY